ncbi:hypothetical protein [Sporichthya polymorpha]|uniref:hypothetical protein n=1 Tax=Sporichthya polymorpha TaxID=35751 RepID=UPI001FE1424E|nr:hypothetical protein [Sporichthya polymorpha]
MGTNDVVSWIRVQWDRAGAWTCLVAGAITLLVGWVGVSNTAYTAKQLPYLAGAGLGGLFLIATAGILWLSADLRDEWHKLDRIEQAIRECGTAGLEQATRRSAAATAPLDVTNGRPTDERARAVAGSPS